MEISLQTEIAAKAICSALGDSCENWMYYIEAADAVINALA